MNIDVNSDIMQRPHNEGVRDIRELIRTSIAPAGGNDGFRNSDF